MRDREGGQERTRELGREMERDSDIYGNREGEMKTGREVIFLKFKNKTIITLGRIIKRTT